MTNSTAGLGDLGLFETRFSIGATILAVLAVVLGIVLGVMGYQEMSIPLAGELSIVTGMVGLLFGLFFGIVAFVAAAYMDSGYGDDHGH
ncbi:hypothetical protein QA600_14265 [Natronococcus sp. A-GB1]|uniref:hypothetical protein n=1 Tax=Natronococcus sp. A-GB1 TaxID=3037648 RepID=UPI00241FE8E8|nr:hypothetical protein [Natronococcus sp. A-GB1]MDG5760500.1 hypothetical protein [Natronococcus sp. A-GB1]